MSIKLELVVEGCCLSRLTWLVGEGGVGSVGCDSGVSLVAGAVRRLDPSASGGRRPRRDAKVRNGPEVAVAKIGR